MTVEHLFSGVSAQGRVRGPMSRFFPMRSRLLLAANGRRPPCLVPGAEGSPRSRCWPVGLSRTAMNAVEDNPAPLRSPVTGGNVRLPSV